MDLYSDFCNICYKTDDVILKDISEENTKHLKDTLITFLGHADIINYGIINLCQLCCEVLISSNKFREMCLYNLIQLRQSVFDMRSKLELEDETCAVENTLQIFVHEEVRRRNTFAKSNYPVYNPTKHEILKIPPDLSKNNSFLNTQIINLQSEINECKFAGNCSDESVINNVDECYESQVSFTNEDYEFVKCERRQYAEGFECKTQEFDVKREIDDFALRNFENKSDVNINFEVPGVNNNEGIVNSGIEYTKEELRLKQENSTSEDLELETIEDEYGSSKNVPFEVDNVCTIVNMEKCGASTVTIDENVRDGMKSPGRDTSPATISNMETFRPHVQEHSNGIYPTALQSGVHKQVYPDAEPYTSALCTNSFASSTYLTRHEGTYIDAEPYKCPVCNKTFTHSSGLSRHKRIHTGERPYKCTVCTKTFAAPSNLTAHERIHSGAKPYKCTFCNKAFTQSSHLTVHKRTHSGTRPYKCRVCNTAFTQSSNLTAHERTHGGDRPYECSVCHKSFLYSSILTRHKLTHSSDKLY